ncbi:MAG: MFS transporter [Alphaproteobacteria bacterium]|nr:MFS transporter [Alphaproteobacteria bacterium]MBU1515509.1 MFS transporter [Alphaproteobacteria bacterium]MBU2095507.1 MFS transporter [Alphaproteobacteria bacterium]MBU2150748.1 MFS transporter [Alphaproteobacteria bacterium]MBU2307013.1 MFS transporter [Alphaproteobacteria bacterium]
MIATAARDARLPLGLAMAFAATSLPLQALQIAGAVHLPAYFAASIGVELTVVGAAFATVRLIDVPIEPALGIAMDRTRSRFGRYRLWTILGTPALMLGLYMLLTARQGVGTAYLITWLLVMYLGASILMLAHQAWASTLAKTYDDRARLFGVMAAIGVTGAFSVLLIPIVMGRMGYPEAQGVRAMIWYLIALTPIAVAVVVWRTPERIAPEPAGQRFRLRDYLELITDPSMGRILLADLALSLGPGWMAALYLFYSRDRMGFSAGEANILLAVYIIAGVVGAPVLAWLATRISKHRTVMLCAACYSLLLVTLAFLPRGNVLASIPTLFFTGFMAAGFNVLTRAMTADVADEIRLKQGKERSGLLYALTTLTTKIAAGGSIFLTFTVLDRMGYDPKLGQANTPEALDALLASFLIGPIGFVLLGGACLIGYGLTAERAAEVRRQLNARDNGIPYDPAAALEGLTGEEPARP